MVRIGCTVTVIADNFAEEDLVLEGALVLAGLFVIAMIIIATLGNRSHRREVQAVQRLIDPHIAALALRRRQLSYLDPYSKPVLDDWRKEQKRFFERHIAPAFGGEFRMKYLSSWQTFPMLDRSVDAYETERTLPPVSLATTDPKAYEEAVAQALATMGWDCRTTRSTGDQGADVIACKEGVKVIVQCKLYSNPVGNKAVQEVHAAVAYEAAQAGAVVTNATFTKSARMLAESTGILLLHHSELDTLADLTMQLR